jgi:hypothetical protein
VTTIKRKRGRPVNTGPYKEKTVQMRIPVGLLDMIKKLLAEYVLKKAPK